MKIFLLITALAFSSGVWANCDSVQGAHNTAECYSKKVTSLKKQLNQSYIKLHNQTDAKKELDVAQKAWLVYSEEQCGTFTVAAYPLGMGQIISDLSCQADLLESRIKYIKSITE